MWRQVFAICLLITLSDICIGVHATLEQEYEFENFEQAINKLSRSNYEKARRSEHLQVDAPSESNIRGTGLGEIEKDVKDPEEPGTSAGESGSKTGDSTKTNETGKTTEHTPHNPPQALGRDHHKTHTANNVGLFDNNGIVFIVIVAACSVAGLVGIIMAGVCWYKLNRSAKAASDVEYPAYGVTGPNKERIPSPGDRKLAQSAQMYHYQHQKQQMIAMEKANGEMKHDASDEESEEENEEGDYTVYECPGLAPTGEMEVKNPLFSDETPVTPSAGDDKKE